MSYTIVTDSSCCLPPAVLREHGIDVIPIPFQIDGVTFRDGELTASEFYERLRTSRGRASTQAPSPGDFLSAFQRAQGAGVEGVVCITLPESYSGTYQAALAAEQVAADTMPGLAVRVVDSGGLAMVHGFAVLAAAQEACRGGVASFIADAAVQRAATAHLVGTLDSTHYLAQSGRVPRVMHWAASALRIRPVFAAEGTRTHSIGRARTEDAAVRGIVAYIDSHSGGGNSLRFAVMHADALERAEGLAATLGARVDATAGVMVTEFTPVMGIHTGPGSLAVAFYAE